MTHVRVLSPESAFAILERNHVARLAVSLHDHVDIAPVHYVFHDGSLYVRTSEGSKLRTLLHHPYVAVEVDEIESLFDWRSVILQGFVEVVDPQVNHDRYEHALGKLRELVPEALTDKDPAPARKVVLRIHASAVRARESTSA